MYTPWWYINVMLRYVFLMCVMFFTAMASAFARPVSYPTGWTVITENNAMENSALLHYTLTPKTAIGYRYAYDRPTQDGSHGVQINNLLHRWNNPGSQANIYLKSAVGVIDQDDGFAAEGFTGMQADWENRRVMVMYENRATLSADGERSRFMQQAGFGVAPYFAEFGAFHTWAMIHVVHRPDQSKPIQFEPMLRFFKGPVLVETGYNITVNKPVVNATFRF